MIETNLSLVPKHMQRTFISPRPSSLRGNGIPKPDKCLPPSMPRLVRFLADLKRLSPHLSTKRIREADAFARQRFEAIERQSGLPAWVHQIGTAFCLVNCLGLGEETSILSAFGHDAIEDTGTSFAELEQRFGQEVARIVQGVSNVKHRELSDAAQGYKEVLELLRQIQEVDLRIALVRLADRLHNMDTIEGVKKKSRREAKAEDTINVQSVLADALGARMVRDLLRDLSLRVLEPRIYSQLVKWVMANQGEETKAANEIVRILKASYSGLEIEAEVMVRPKSIYKLYLEMMRRKQTQPNFDVLEAVYFVTRVADESDIYNTLNALHAPPFVPGQLFDNFHYPRWNGLKEIKVVASFGNYGRVEHYVFDPLNELFSRWGIPIYYYLEGATWRQRELPAVQTMLQHTEVSDPERLGQAVGGLRRQIEYVNFRGEPARIAEGATVMDAAIQDEPEDGLFASSFRVEGAEVDPAFTAFEHKRVVFSVDKNKAPGFGMWKLLKTEYARGILRKYFDSKGRKYVVQLGGKTFSERLLGRLHNRLREISTDKEFISQLLGLLGEKGFAVKNMNELFYNLGAGVYDFEEVWKACVESYEGMINKLQDDKIVKPKTYAVKMVIKNKPGEQARVTHDFGNVFINLSPGSKTYEIEGKPGVVFEFSAEYHFDFQLEQIKRIVRERNQLIT